MRVIGWLCVCVCECWLCVRVCGCRWKCWRGTFHPGVVLCIARVMQCVLQCVLQCETGVCVGVGGGVSKTRFIFVLYSVMQCAMKCVL